jgi:hypothetical protein
MRSLALGGKTLQARMIWKFRFGLGWEIGLGLKPHRGSTGSTSEVVGFVKIRALATCLHRGIRRARGTLLEGGVTRQHGSERKERGKEDEKERCRCRCSCGYEV